ncbi:DUF2946 family protein [Achromobacter aegrifaciens]|uniref:DUF2946 family protein n=1 Tax=Achromobacter aegrifaciens TaxID=1287736 RepID=UPI0028ADB3F0|nr:DUF2946 family protein [Achromobacter aegrifaciens]
MTRLIRLQHLGSAARARGVLWLALLALALRALVPAGYMPDARALHDGRLEVTFCSAAGDVSALALSPEDKGKAGHDTADAGALCPFGLLAHVAPAPAPALTPLLLAAGRHALPAPASATPPTPAAAGPPLGSRAPPRLV